MSQALAQFQSHTTLGDPGPTVSCQHERLAPGVAA